MQSSKVDENEKKMDGEKLGFFFFGFIFVFFDKRGKIYLK